MPHKCGTPARTWMRRMICRLEVDAAKNFSIRASVSELLLRPIPTGRDAGRLLQRKRPGHVCAGPCCLIPNFTSQRQLRFELRRLRASRALSRGLRPCPGACGGR